MGQQGEVEPVVDGVDARALDPRRGPLELAAGLVAVAERQGAAGPAEPDGGRERGDAHGRAVVGGDPGEGAAVVLGVGPVEEPLVLDPVARFERAVGEVGQHVGQPGAELGALVELRAGPQATPGVGEAAALELDPGGGVQPGALQARVADEAAGGQRLGGGGAGEVEAQGAAVADGERGRGHPQQPRRVDPAQDVERAAHRGGGVVGAAGVEVQAAEQVEHPGLVLEAAERPGARQGPVDERQRRGGVARLAGADDGQDEPAALVVGGLLDGVDRVEQRPGAAVVADGPGPVRGAEVHPQAARRIVGRGGGQRDAGVAGLLGR
ncbi:MAG: hypothetical protein R3F65_32960 [bacterium]